MFISFLFLFFFPEGKCWPCTVCSAYVAVYSGCPFMCRHALPPRLCRVVHDIDFLVWCSTVRRLGMHIFLKSEIVWIHGHHRFMWSNFLNYAVIMRSSKKWVCGYAWRTHMGNHVMKARVFQIFNTIMRRLCRLSRIMREIPRPRNRVELWGQHTFHGWCSKGCTQRRDFYDVPPLQPITVSCFGVGTPCCYVAWNNPQDQNTSVIQIVGTQ